LSFEQIKQTQFTLPSWAKSCNSLTTTVSSLVSK
jgi:hypothetical protein